MKDIIKEETLKEDELKMEAYRFLTKYPDPEAELIQILMDSGFSETEAEMLLLGYLIEKMDTFLKEHPEDPH